MGSWPTRAEMAAVAAAALTVTFAFDDLLVTASLVVLWMIWKALVVRGMPPVLPLAMSFQWVQIAGGLVYCTIFDRWMPTLDVPEHRTMVMLGLGCIIALTTGLAVGVRAIGLRHFSRSESEGLTMRLLVISYVVLTMSEGSINQFAWRVPSLTQAILAIALIRLGVVYLLFRRLSWPRLKIAPLTALLAAEVVLGFLGFFAGFREPLILAALVLLERARQRPSEMLPLAALAVVATVVGVLWMGVRSEFRAEFSENETFAASRSVRLERMAELVQGWASRGTREFGYDVDFFVDRVWAIYYPSLAIQRVPLLIPHTNGQFVSDAVLHIVTPRILFPDKAELPSDSEKVRRYSGVWVAGRDEGTSIAFGYAAESYVDYGTTWMFAPILMFGCLMGAAFAFLTRRIRIADFGVPLITVAFWLSLYLFERSWAKLLGDTATMFLYLGGIIFVLERLVRSGRLKTVSQLNAGANAVRRAYRPPVPARIESGQ
jgi:hypothetical protein